MTADSAAPKFVGTVPYVWARDVQATADFYREVLGFTVDFAHAWEREGRKCGLAMMSREGVELEVRTCECPDQRHTGMAHFKLEVRGVDALHEEWKAKGATFSWEPQTEPWGIRHTRLEDPDGNFVFLWERV